MPARHKGNIFCEMTRMWYRVGRKYKMPADSLVALDQKVSTLKYTQSCDNTDSGCDKTDGRLDVQDF